MDSRKDLIFALAVIALGVVVILIAHSWPEPHIRDAVGPRAFPYGLGILFIVGGAFLAIQRARDMNAAGGYVVSGGNEDEAGYPASGIRALTLVVLCCVYAYLLRPLGFLVATPPFVVLALLTMQERKPVSVIATAISFTIIAYLIIHTALDGLLPEGILAGLLPY
jgi:putative tricarboxylic transport membrane protein